MTSAGPSVASQVTAPLLNSEQLNPAYEHQVVAVPRAKAGRVPNIFQRGGPSTQRPPLSEAAKGDVFERFWVGIDTGDAGMVKKALNSVGGVQQLGLLSKPRAKPQVGGNLQPQLPLCQAAYDGNVDVMKVLLGAHCNPWYGDVDPQNPDEPAYTAAFWAATRGQVKALKLMYERTQNCTQPLRGLCSIVNADTARWLSSIGVGGAEMINPLSWAILRELGGDSFNAEDIRILVKEGKADVNQLFDMHLYRVTADDGAGHSTEERATALGLALEKKCWAAAQMLINLDANVAGNPKVEGRLQYLSSRAPIMLAIRANQHAIVEQLLQRRAPTHPNCLRAALATPCEADAQQMYLRLYRHGCKPDLSDAVELMEMATSQKFHQLRYFISQQRGLLELLNEKSVARDDAMSAALHPSVGAQRAAVEAVADALAGPDALSLGDLELDGLSAPNFQSTADLVRRSQMGKVGRTAQRHATAAARAVTALPMNALALMQRRR